MSSKKRAQGNVVDAGQASLLILIIIGAILLYVLLVPPDVREALLSDNETDDNGNGDDTDEEDNILLEEEPGRIAKLDETRYDHQLPSLYLYKTTNSEVLERVSSVFVKNAVFDRRLANLTFAIHDLENTNNFILTFKATRRHGMLFIRLNGREIFAGEINQYNPEPINLPKEFLEEDNTLTFETSDPGWRIWLSHEYLLNDLRIIADVTDVSRQESKNVFYLSETEYNNIERVSIEFLPECTPSSVGPLDVTVNYQEVFSGIPDCGILNSYQFSPEILDTGSNRVIFKTNSGNYLIDRINVETRLEDLPDLVYYFQIEQDQYDDIKEDVYDVNLTMEFVDDRNVKDGHLVINGRETGFYTRRRIYSKIIDSYVQEGNNALKIVPKDDLDIVNLVVELT